jgi:hypothetical protein
MPAKHIEGVGKPEGAKLIRISAEIDDGIIRAISIRGDFFASPEEGFERAEARLSGIPLAKAAAAFDIFLSEEKVEAFGISGAALAEVLAAAVTAEAAPDPVATPDPAASDAAPKRRTP